MFSPTSPTSPASPSPAAADLITDRLVLRPWSGAETAAVLAGLRQPHWAADFPAAGDHVIAGFVAEHPASRGEFGQRQIIEWTTGLVVGAIGLFWPPADGCLEIGYGVVPSRRGRGYATEATRALVAFARSAPDVHTVCARVEVANPASGRVLARAGLERTGGDGEHDMFRTPPPSGR